MTRRDAIRSLGVWLAGSPLIQAQQSLRLPDRIPSMDQLVNVLEFEPVAKTRLPIQSYDYIAVGSTMSELCIATGKHSTGSSCARGCCRT